MFNAAEYVVRGRARPILASLVPSRVAVAAGLAICLAGGPAMARTVEYNIDQNTASIQFSTRIVKIVPIDGTFTHFAGLVRMDPDHPASIQVDIVIDDSQMTAPYGGAKVLQSTAYFDQEKFPTIRFHSDGVQELPNDHFAIIGSLTIRGVSHRQILKGAVTHTVVDGIPALRIVAKSQLDRSDFGMMADRPFIANQVMLDISTTLRDP